MNATTEQLLGRRSGVTPNSDRLEYTEALIASLQPDDRPPFDESWREVIQRRFRRSCAPGSVKAIPWAEVKRQAREKAGG